MRLITPKRLKENEEFMWRLADRQIDEFIVRGECEFIHEYANPFTLLVIADLLGVPEEDHEALREELQGDRRPTNASGPVAHKPLEFLYERFTKLHRGAPPRAARRRHDGAGHRDRSPTARCRRSTTSC